MQNFKPEFKLKFLILKFMKVVVCRATQKMIRMQYDVYVPNKYQ